MATEDRRASERVRDRNTVAVTIISAPEAPHLVNRTYFCTTDDISLCGIRLTSKQPMPGGANLVVRVAFHDPLCSFQHTGKIVWCVPNEKHHLTGIELHRFEGADIVEWSAILQKKLGHQPRYPRRWLS